jgi:hypothetical protein
MIAGTRKSAHLFALVLAAMLFLLSLARPSCAQTTVGTGSIVGTVSDPSGAVVSVAKITITNIATGQVIELATNSAGFVQLGSADSGQIQNAGFGEGLHRSGSSGGRPPWQHDHGECETSDREREGSY